MWGIESLTKKKKRQTAVGLMGDRRVRTAAGLVFALSSFAGHAQEPVRAHFIAVGQGDATLFEFPGCGVMLIDVGATLNQPADPLINYLEAFFSAHPEFGNTIDLIVNTHQHDDHLRSLDEVLERYTVLRYVDNGPPLAPNSEQIRRHVALSGVPVEVFEVPDSLVVAAASNGLTNEVIDPFNCEGMDPLVRILSGRLEERPEEWSVKEFQDPNNHSLVIRVDYGQASFLFTGDMEDVAIEYMVGYYEGTGALDVDVYQAGHHGSSNGTTKSLIEAMTPLISVMSMGEMTFGMNTNAIGTAWQHGHPGREVVHALSRATKRRRSSPIVAMAATGPKEFESMRISRAVYGTGWEGSIVVQAEFDGTYRVTVDN